MAEFKSSSLQQRQQCRQAPGVNPGAGIPLVRHGDWGRHARSQQWQQEKRQQRRKRQRTGKGAKEKRRQKRAGLQGHPRRPKDMNGEAKLEAALAKALQRIQQLKAELEAAKMEIVCAGLGPAAKPDATMAGGGSNAAYPEPSWW